MIGRNYMVHNNSALMAVRPWELNTTTFQKILSVNDGILEEMNGTDLWETSK